MPANAQQIPVEGFISDLAFVNRNSHINGILDSTTSMVGSLNPKALSYFNTPSELIDTRPPASRTVGWSATTSSKLTVDSTSYGNFVTTINNLGTSISTGFFKIVDALMFDSSANRTQAQLEAFITADPDMSAIYTPGTLSVSTNVIQAPVYGTSVSTVPVPSFIGFTISVLSGSTVESYAFTLFTSVSAFLTGYTPSTIVSVVFPLTFVQMYEDPLLTSTGNIFSTSSATSSLAFNTTQALLGTIQVSGMIEFIMTLTDSSANTAPIPINILYKGNTPTQQEIRLAIQAKLNASGVGTVSGWQARVPGIYVSGRFYIIPLWSDTLTKADEIIYPSIQPITNFTNVTNKILSSLGLGDLTSNTDVFPTFFNKMYVTAVPDLSGATTPTHLSLVLPDYQDYNTQDANFGYMTLNSQAFANNLNAILALDYSNASSSAYTAANENDLTFYSFAVDNYEMCVITRTCYNAIMGGSV